MTTEVFLLTEEGKPRECFFDLNQAKATYRGPVESWHFLGAGVWYNSTTETKIHTLPLTFNMAPIIPSAHHVPITPKECRRNLCRLLMDYTPAELAEKIDKTVPWIMDRINEKL